MDHYIDLRLKPDPEFPATILLSALFGKVHKGLVSHGPGKIGVSFPEIKDGVTLGAHLRLHGEAEVLSRFFAQDWLTGLRDHVSVGAITPVPAGVQHRVVRRVQAKSNPEKERRRLIARKGISEEAARAAIPDEAAKLLKLPYVVLGSQSTGQRFRLFVEHLPPQPSPSPGVFSAYGLSPTATVPWF